MNRIEPIDNEREEFLQYLKEEREKLQPNVSNYEGSAWDAVGQFVWGLTDQSLVGMLGVSDAISEAYKGDAANTWEEMIAGGLGAETGSYEELSDWGKGGYAAGAALGQIPSFWLGGMFTQGAIKGVGKATGWGIKASVKKSAKELVEEASKMKTKQATINLSKSVTDDVATSIVDDAYKLSQGAGAIGRIEGKLASDMYEKAMIEGLKGNIGKTLNIADDELLEGVAKSTFDIITKNNPDDAFSLITTGISKLPYFKDSPKATLLAGAMGYDAIIGGVLGTMRTGIQEFQRSMWNVAPDEYGDMKRLDDPYSFDLARVGKNWAYNALLDAAMFAPMGAAQFVRGGTVGGHGKRLVNGLHAAAKSYWKPLSKYTNKELRAQLTAMDEIAGGYLSLGRGKEFEKLGVKWWRDATTDTDTKLMRKYLGQIRKEYLTKAPYYWAKEFSQDVFYSLPRMATGVLAMHTPQMIMAFNRDGFSTESFQNAMGNSGPEIAANIFTAMYFTKKPHSFHTETTSATFNNVFQTGKVQEYYGGKQSKLRKMLGGLNTFGVDRDALMGVVSKYDQRSLTDYQQEAGENAIRRAIDKSPELNEVKQILSPLEGKAEEGGADFKIAFAKKIQELIKSGALTPEETAPLYDNLLIAEKIIETYNNNAPNKLNILNVSPNTAYDLVTKLSSIKFDGQLLDKARYPEQLKSWAERSVSDAIRQPQNLLKEYIVSMYKALGREGIEIDEFGVIKAPSIDKLDFGNSEIKTIFHTIYNRGIKNNWILPEGILRREEHAIDGEIQGNLKTVHDSMNERMMNYVWGGNWKGSIDLDPLILTNDAWHMTYDSYLRHEQRRNAYEIFTEGTKHNATKQEATDLLDAIDQLMLYRKRPEIEEDADANYDYGELNSFIDNLHSTVLALNPTITKQVGGSLKAAEANALMNDVNSLVGDVISNPESFKEFKQYIFNKSLDRLGLNDIATGVDVKASILSLRNNVDFNQQTDGPRMILPSRERILGELLTAKTSGKISKEAYAELKDHYNFIVDNIEAARFPVDFDQGLVKPDEEGAWIKALTRSLVEGKDKIDIFSTDKSRQMADLLENLADRENMLHKHIAAGMDIIDDTMRRDMKAQLQALNDSREITSNFAELIKRALTERNKAVLDAVARKEGDIQRVLDLLARNPYDSDRNKYLTELAKLEQKIKTDSQRTIIKDESIKELIRTELSRYNDDIPDRDLQDNAMRITSSQFQVKYNINHKYIDDIFSMDKSTVKSSKEIQAFAEHLFGDFWSMPNEVRSPELRDQVITAIRTLKATARDVELTDVNFNNFVVKPLKLAMKLEMDKLPESDRVDADVMAADLYSITSSYFSKTPVKTLKVNLNNNTLSLGSKVVGDIDSRGLMGIINYLDKGQKNIYLAETSGINKDGSTIRDINGWELTTLNGALSSGNMELDNPIGKKDFYRHGDPTTLKDRDLRGADLKARYRIVPMNEKTSLIIRVDGGKGGIHQQIQAQFGKDGELYKMLLAAMDGDLSQDSKRGVLDLLTKIREAKTDVDVVEAVKLTRLLLDLPHAIEKVVTNDGIDLDHAFIKETFKRAALVETKNGFVPTNKNMGRFINLYKNSESNLHRKIYETLSRKGWLTPDADGNYRKLKTLSIDDEAKLVDSNENPLTNIFNSLDRAKFELDERLDKNEIDQPTYDKNIALIKDATKSIVDGEMFLSRDAYLMAMSMIGVHPDMVRMDDNGRIYGFKSGGIKPTITHSDINFDKSSKEYGKVQTWFGKTAFKYNPLLDKLMKQLGVDALTFKSANKINTLKAKKNADYSDMYAKPLGSKDKADLSKTWDKYLSDGNIEDPTSKIIELPWESMSLRTISKEHDPLAGSNLGVHLHHRNGIADWIGINNKIDKYNTNLTNMYNNSFYRTKLAQRVLGSQSEAGDPSIVNSAIGSILARDGLIIEPWAQKILEDSMIGYFMNNGGIAGGVVEHGSLDVMTADMGNLKTTVRSDINGRKTVQYYGEFLPSFYAAQKHFVKGGEDNTGAENMLIQSIKYETKDQAPRSADGFMLKVDDSRYLIVEGRGIDSEGRIVNLENFNIIGKKNSVNKVAFEKAEELHNKGMGLIPANTTLADAALVLQQEGLSIGMLNSRQPRNMIGDIVISKMAIVDGQAHVDEAAGNVSRMNHMDAIKPQDADFDMDKSFNYVAAPALFWKEASRVAGEITPESVEGKLNELFSPDRQVEGFARSIPDLLSADITNDQLLHEVNKARGQFVKMHQTVTYLSNIFRDHPEVLKFAMADVTGRDKSLTVKLKDSSQYANTVDNITRLATKFIDVYKKLPSKLDADELQLRKTEVLFGKDGIFEIWTEGTAKGDNKVLDVDLTAPKYRDIVETINRRLINPINRYLRYNKGIYEDPGSGIENKATIRNYHDAYVELHQAMNKFDNFGIKPTVDISTGLTAMADYFTSSRNPFDIAMKGLHEIYEKSTHTKQAGMMSGESTEAKVIMKYISDGYGDEIVGKTLQEKRNQLLNTALKHYVKDEGGIIRLNDLARQENHLKLEIERKKAFVKDVDDSQELTNLTQRLERVSRLRSDMEESLSYMFKDNFIEQPRTIPHRGHKPSRYVNNQTKPVVIVDKGGNIKEVISVGSRNDRFINLSDKIIENGRRFEIGDGEVQKGLRVLFQAFSGMPSIIEADGNVRRIKKSEFEYITRDYNAIVSEVMRLQKVGVQREGIVDFVLEKERVLYDALFNNPKTAEDVSYRKALILQMLTPYVSDKVVSVRALNTHSSKNVVYDYMYSENALSKDVLSLLAKIQSGEHKGDPVFAKEMLDDINQLKTVALIQTENPNIDFNLVKARMHTEPASIDGYMTKDKYLNQDIYDKVNSGDEITRTAAEVMVKYAQGDGIVDPVLLYKASQEMAKKNIPYHEQWANRRMIADDDGVVRDFGVKERLINEADSISRKDLGERGGQGETASARVRDIFDCYGLGD
tara:strand:- start:3438 stop:12314 length:8877 start_codon:yes stop_codon:yes gene_type:complete